MHNIILEHPLIKKLYREIYSKKKKIKMEYKICLPVSQERRKQKQTMRNKEIKQETDKMADLNPNISVITLNVNGPNTPI